MEYNYTAYSIGWFANKVIKKEKRAIVQYIFENTFYLNYGNDMVVVTRKNYPSSITIILSSDKQGKPFNNILRIGGEAYTSKNTIRIGSLTINIDRPEIYRPRNLPDPDAESLKVAKEIFGKPLKAILILYSCTPVKNPLFKTLEFKKFIDEVVYPFSRRQTDVIHDPEKYRILLGVGEGFTPSGDDFLLGFIVTINLFDKLLSIRKIRLDEKLLLNSTAWVSAMYLKYTQLGIYDERIENFLSALLEGDENMAIDTLISIIERGHISGLDISLGIITGLACILEYLGERGFVSNIMRYMENFY
jgi:hypothetical protein